MRFDLVGAGQALQWRIDGQPADPDWLEATGGLLWPPQPGAHRISVQTPDGRVVDAMFVTVK